MNNMNYKIALQSKKMLTDGLLKLMITNDFSTITVTQICQEANLSRRTFYRLYKSKEDILSEYLFLLAEEFKSIVSEAVPKHYIEVAAIYFSFWKQHEDFLNLLKKNKMLEVIYNTAREMAPSVFKTVKPNTQLDVDALSFALSYSLGGLNGMLIQWVEDGMRLSSDQLVAILKQTLKIAVN